MEITTLISIFGRIAAPVAKVLFQQAGSRLNKYFNPTSIEKAIMAGGSAVEEWEKRQQLQDRLFYRVSSDGWKNYRKYLARVFKHAGVLKQLEKPLTDSGQPDVDILVELFKREAEAYKINLVEESLRPWVQRFVSGYCRDIGIYIEFEVAKITYCEQLAKEFDKVQFVGIAVEGQEVDKSDRLPEIFVMPDVEDISTGSIALEREFMWDKDRSRQAELVPEQSTRSLMLNSSGSKFLASQLLGESRSPNKAVLLGAPGSGKTTLMSYFALMLARPNPEALGFAADADWLPILIRIRDWERQSEEMTLLEYAQYSAGKLLESKTLPVGFFEHWLENGRALILLDGLDEVAELSKRERMVRRIESFLNLYPQNWAIVTSRPAGYRRDFFRTEEFPHYELQPFDDDKIVQFIENWYNSRVRDPEGAQRRKENLRGALEESDRIKLLARNPLLLTIIALIHRYQAVLPKERHKLYDKAVETLLTYWDKNKEISSHKVLQHLNFANLRWLMKSLAHWVHNQGSVGENEGGTLINKDDLIRELTDKIKKKKKKLDLDEAREEAKRFLSLMRDRAGLLNEQGRDCYAFVHKTFQEYLCAQEINDLAYRDFGIVRKHLLDRLHDSHWREVLLLLVAQQRLENATDAVREILDAGSEYEELLHRDLLFAGSCLAENPSDFQEADEEDELSGRILQRLVDLEVSKRTGERVRWRVLKIICSFKETEFQEQALEFLKERTGEINEERLLQYRAALGEEEKILETLVTRLEDEDSLVRRSAALALGSLGKSSEIVISALVELLKDEESSVRWSAAIALGNLGKNSENVVSALVELLEDEESFVRWSATFVLGNLGKSVVSHLMELLKDEKSSVRKSAALALGSLGKNSENVISALVELLKDEESSVGWSAALALGSLGKNSLNVVSALMELLKDEESSVRGNAALALGKLDKISPNVVSALVELLKDEESYVRANAGFALGDLGKSSPTVVSALVKLLKDEESSVRANAAIALSNLGKSSQAVVSALVQLLKDEESSARRSAAIALGNLGKNSENVVSALMELLKDENPDVRRSAAIALGNLGKSSETVVSALMELLKDEDSSMRGKAAIALGKLGKSSTDVAPAVVQWIEQHQDSEYLGDGIDALWDAVVEEQS